MYTCLWYSCIVEPVRRSCTLLLYEDIDCVMSCHTVSPGATVSGHRDGLTATHPQTPPAAGPKSLQGQSQGRCELSQAATNSLHGSIH